MSNSDTLSPARTARRAPSAEPKTAAVRKPAALRMAQTNALHDLLEQARVLCVLLVHNYGGDGGFAVPSTAPGIDWLPGMVESLLGSADAFANEIDAAFEAEEAIACAHQLARHMNGLAGEELLDNTTGFRLGNHAVAGAYWTIEQLINKAVNAGGAQ